MTPKKRTAAVQGDGHYILANREDVLLVLRSVKPRLSVTERKDSMVIIVGPDSKSCEYIPSQVSRRTVNSIARKFNIMKELFYQPMLLDDSTSGRRPS